MGDSDATITDGSSFHGVLTGDGFTDGDEWDEVLAQINLNLNDLPKASEGSGHVYKYRNVPIQFPYRAYPSQRQMMEKIIEGVTTAENCLLESPTGTGKTAALLCALLGWQKDCYKRGDYCSSVIEAAAERMGGCTCGLIKDIERTKVLLVQEKSELFLQATTYPEETEPENKQTPQVPELTVKTSSPIKTTTKTLPPTSPINAATKTLPPPSSCLETPTKVKCSDDPVSSGTEQGPSPRKRQKQCESEVVKRRVSNACGYCVRKYVHDKSRPPRIYYCTRTHSQIAQVIKQLKATAYKDTKMTILAGREPTCINETVIKVVNSADLLSQSQNNQIQTQQHKNELKLTLGDFCSTLKRNYYTIKNGYLKEGQEGEPLVPKPEVCKYFAEKDYLIGAFSGLQSHGAWDLEDLKKEGMECQKCPFFGSNALHAEADIIFGSYNYLLQPSIREAKEVKFINSVLVFDEAHNIEDICRNAFSFTFEVDSFDKNIRGLVDSLIIKAGDPQARAKVKGSTLKALNSVSVTFKMWSDMIREWGAKMVEAMGRNKDKNKMRDISKPFESKELKEALIEMDLTAESVSHCLSLGGLEDEDEKTRDQDDIAGQDYYIDSHGHQRPFKLSSKVGEYLKKIRQTLKYLCEEEIDGIGGAKDFKGYLTGVANPSREAFKNQSDFSRRNRSLRNSLREQEQGPEYFFKFEIICLNPAVGFRTLRDSAYSIIVASGTLTPLNSFASELATKFGVTLQADHVIPTSNVWAGVISSGPSNQDFHLNKAHQDDLAMQDDIGKVIRDVCYTVPNGVLVFFPSYSLMTKLEERWNKYPEGSGNSILQQITKKKMLFREDSKDKNAFKLNMESYKQHVKGGSTWDGCILFAVFRGKISEGIDFADEQARAVVTIGIPFSNAGAAEIVSKRAYNDMRKKTMRQGETFLSGSDWYTTQAFRAMNQGFGRCVRHCADWGALILIDSRLTSRYDRFISSWVKKSKNTYKTFSEVKSSLVRFIEAMKNQMKAPREHIQIAYEDDDLDCTEVLQWPDDSAEMNSQDDELLTQIASLHDYRLHNMTTQRLQMSSTPIPEIEVTQVGESSPEYSFSEELDEVMGALPSPIAPEVEVNADVEADQNSDGSVSIFQRTPSISGNESDNESDREMFDIADRLQSSVSDQLSPRSQLDLLQDQSDNLDVSMPSASASENNMSQMSDISYHSEWDHSLS